MTSRCTAAGPCDFHRDRAADPNTAPGTTAKCPWYCDYGTCRRKAVHESRGGRSYCAEHAGRSGRLPGSTRGGSRVIQYRVSDAQYAELAREGNGNANAAAKARAFGAAPPSTKGTP